MNKLELYNSLPEDYRKLVDESVSTGMDFDEAVVCTLQLMAVLDSQKFAELFIQTVEEGG